MQLSLLVVLSTGILQYSVALVSVLVFSWEPNLLKGRELWDTAGYKRVSHVCMSLKACTYKKKGMMLLPHGIERYSVRPWRVWNYDKSLSSTSE